MIYQFAPGYHARKMDPQAVGEHLEDLRAGGHGLTPDVLVQSARKVTSPIHAAFEWNDGVAADEFRKAQARQLLASVVLVEADGMDLQEPIRAYVHIDGEEGGSYQALAVVLGDTELRKQAVDKALCELLAWQKRYSQLKELASVFTAIKKVAA